MIFQIKTGVSVMMCISDAETDAVKIAAANLEKDIKKVFHKTDVLKDAEKVDEHTVVIHIETKSADQFQHKETYCIEVKEGQLYISGSDRRGTIYGIYTFCEMLGVSPWYFFADVPVKKKDSFVLEEGYHIVDWPSVEYRGIFINDEEELEQWVINYLKEPTIGLKAYEKIFELLLRLKANYIWPAMHVNSFNLTPENGALADRMGIVVGTSHCDMLMRSNNREWQPWIKKKGYADAKYDYSIEGKNREILKEYWRESVEQNRNYEVCYTLGMRGIHDSGFETSDLESRSEEEIRRAKVELLTKIITDQREILKGTLGRETMMTFVPYKEVLELYDNGLEIPEDMTLVWANDNYGHIRRFPGEKEKNRRGGNGVYYHNSYWAPPSMHHLFICSIPLAHTRNELQKAWNEGIRKLWMMNVGAIKPLEQEISFYLRLAWEIGKDGALTENTEAFAEDWINSTFSGDIGREAAMLLCDFSQLTNVRKIENMDYDAFSQTAYGDEAAVRIHKYEELFAKGNSLYEVLPEEEKDAFYQMVLMRIHAAYFTNLAYYYGDRSTLMYERGNMQAAAEYTEKCRQFEDARRKMVLYYNTVMAEGKWNGIVNPEGFPPPRAAMMPVCTPPLKIEGKPCMRVDIWNNEEQIEFVNLTEKWIDIGNTGTGAIEVKIEVPEWVDASEVTRIATEQRICLRAKDLSKQRNGEIIIHSVGEGRSVRIPVSLRPLSENHIQCSGIVKSIEERRCYPALEEDGFVAIEGDSFIGKKAADFQVIPHLGRSRGSLVEVCGENAAAPDAVEEAWICERNPLAYEFVTATAGEYLLELQRFPSLNSTGRIRIGLALDGGSIQILESESNDEWRGTWKKNVLYNADRLYLKYENVKAGKHMLRVYAVDKYFAFSRILIYTKPRKANQLAGINGNQELPGHFKVEKWCENFYGKIDLKPRPVLWAVPEQEEDSLNVSCKVLQEEVYGKTVQSQWYLQQGQRKFTEMQRSIRIDAAAALAESKFAWTAGNLWKHCAGESFGRSGLCMYVRQPELMWNCEQEAPALHYRFICEGGEYTIWILLKFQDGNFAHYGLGMDGQPFDKEKLYCGGDLFRYEAEKVYRWIPAAKVKLERGDHVLDVYSMNSGILFDRFFLSKSEVDPPMDSDWRRR